MAAKWVPPWTPGLEQKRCPTCRPMAGKQPLVVAATMIDGVCAQCAKAAARGGEEAVRVQAVREAAEGELVLFTGTEAS